MALSLLHNLIDILAKVSRTLRIPVDCCELERVAVMVHRIMSFQSRQYHTLEHVFGFLDGADDITTVAAVFHDLVYLQVDQGLPPDATALLDPYVSISGKDVRFHKAALAGDEDFLLCCAVFGRDPAMDPPAPQGMNEFLSAFLMMKLLGKHLAKPVSVAVLVCIEASIPFRSLDSTGHSMAQALEQRLEEIDRSGLVPIASADRKAMVRRGVTFANTDVKDFILDDPGTFLSNTWKLLPETNYALRYRGAFSIQEYRNALYNMMKFFRFLVPEMVFHDYESVPSPEVMVGFRLRIRRNLDWAVQYLKAKLLAVSVVEAMAELSGGDAPMALFMGDIPQEGEVRVGLMSFIAPVSIPAWLDAANPVLKLLRDGRLEESSFDLKNSPLALWLYMGLAPELWSRLEALAEDLFLGKASAKDLLDALPSPMRKELLLASVEMVPTRVERLRDLAG